MTRVIAIVSGKGGTGKTTLAVNLSIALAGFGKKVVVLDADVELANLSLALGMGGRPITLQDVLKGEANTQDAVYEGPGGIKFVPSSLSVSKIKNIDPEKLSRVIVDLSIFADIIIIDCPAGLSQNVLTCLSVAKEVIIVLTPDPLSATDAYKTKITAERMGCNVLGVVVNQIRGVKNELNEKEIVALLTVPVLAKIEYDKKIAQSIIDGKPLILEEPYSEFSITMKKMAAELIGAAYRPEKAKKGLFSFLFGLIKR